MRANHTADAVAAPAPLSAPDGFVISAQNGLDESVIAERVGLARTLGCFVNYGADHLSPGTVFYGGRGALVVGELDGADTPRLRELQALFRQFEPAIVGVGARVVACDLAEEGLHGTVGLAGVSCTARRLDVTNEAAIVALVSELSGVGTAVDILVNNAGGALGQPQSVERRRREIKPASTISEGHHGTTAGSDEVQPAFATIP